MEVFDVGGIRLAADVSGCVEGTVLVLLHGAGSDRSTWAAVAPAFAPTHRVYAVDLRGFGDSDRPGAYSFEAMRDDVLGLLDVIGADRADLVGHSVGGSVAWLVAQEQPERVAHLVMEDSPIPKPGRARRSLAERPAQEPPFDWAALVAIVREFDDPGPQWWERAGAVTARTLLLAGGAASHVPQHLFTEVLALLRDARIVEIPVGHHIHRDATEQFLAHVVAFLAG
jgi:pimeloyl-ACP methyl ester carboxylesterase